MARKRIEVKLTQDEHESLSTYVTRGQKSAREIKVVLDNNNRHLTPLSAEELPLFCLSF